MFASFYTLQLEALRLTKSVSYLASKRYRVHLRALISFQRQFLLTSPGPEQLLTVQILEDIPQLMLLQVVHVTASGLRLDWTALPVSLD